MVLSQYLVCTQIDTLKKSINTLPQFFKTVRNRDNLTMPIHRTTLFRRSFTYNAILYYNSLAQDLKTIQSSRSFKTQM
ncbi:unnamed protein product [Acanthoscelides obtectus]|uniref:Uncharacterized protein n=1 Tax=Acanthoscelides obtectus TaxID=200917 RepID=A0A9P0LUM2_ACAOB|nr:unnamed protein product [Acanthoscelides obtectus]CAK1685743.1 hypothetical protein AOBTE_LOCUS35579 [Acanthoscelides obtectus]